MWEWKAKMIIFIQSVTLYDIFLNIYKYGNYKQHRCKMEYLKYVFIVLYQNIHSTYWNFVWKTNEDPHYIS